VPARLTAVACLLAALAIGGCASSAKGALDDRSLSSSAPGHGSLTGAQFNVAVAVARAEIEKYAATVTSATATVGEGTVTDPNAGPACTSGTLLHIKLIGTFPTIGVGPLPTAGAPSSIAPSGGVPTDGSGLSVMAVLVTADPLSGKACDLSVRLDQLAPDPGATLLFTH
jgi:hypothetical protein